MEPSFSTSSRTATQRDNSPVSVPDWAERDQIYTAVAEKLRSRSCGISQAMHPLLQARDAAIAAQGDRALEIITEFDQTVVDVLSSRYDALDTAAHQSQIPFAEIDGDGLIVYCNPAFSSLVSDAMGMRFANLFGPRARHVENALVIGRNRSLTVELYQGKKISDRVRLETGPLRDHRGRLGAYALLLDMKAEQKRLNAAPDGIMSVNSEGTINFVNERAERLLAAPSRDLVDREAAQFFQPGSGGASVDLVQSWLKEPKGQREEVCLVSPDRRSIPVCVTVLPYFDVDRPAGIMLTLYPMEEELARRELQSLLDEKVDPKQLVRKVMQIVKRVVPYDMATFGVYTDDMQFFRAIVVDPEPTSWNWDTRWFRVHPKVQEYLQRETKTVGDMRAFLQEHAPEELDNPVVQHLLKENLRSFLPLILEKGEGKYRSALTLLRRGLKAFKGPDEQLLHGLGVMTALIVAEDALRREHDSKVRELQAELASAQSLQEVASQLVKGMSKIFDWDYAAVFKVDRHLSKFVLLAQHDNKARELAVDVGYQQGLDEGLLSDALERRDICIIPDTDKPFPYKFKKVVEHQASAMAIPMNIGGRPELILDVEASEKNAFQGADLDTIREIVRDCEQVLDRRWHEAVNSALLESADQAVVVVDPTGRIRQCNGKALQLFDATRNELREGKPLADYGASKGDQEELGKQSSIYQKRIDLKIGDVSVPALCSHLLIEDDLDHGMWLFTDLRDWDWERDWSYLDQTVKEVARQSRTPILVAGSLLRQASNLLTDPKRVNDCLQMLTRAGKQLGKSDVTFERLAETLSIQRDADDPPRRFDVLAMLQGIIDALPDDDKKLVSLDLRTDNEFELVGWPSRLGFALRSLIEYLLTRGAWGCQIHINAAVGPDLRLLLETNIGDEAIEPENKDPISAAQLRARQRAELALNTIKRAVEQHGGTCTMGFNRTEKRLRFRVMLPFSEGKPT